MRTAKGILFFCAGMLYVLKNAFHYSPLYINVLNDLLAVPVFLMVMEFLMKGLYGKRFKMTRAHIVATVLTISILFEVILPLVVTGLTADPVDASLYASGGLGYGMASFLRNSRDLRGKSHADLADAAD